MAIDAPPWTNVPVYGIKWTNGPNGREFYMSWGVYGEVQKSINEAYKAEWHRLGGE